MASTGGKLRDPEEPHVKGIRLAELAFQVNERIHSRTVERADTLTPSWAALLDRLTHRSHILEFVGESYRFRERMQREAGDKSDD